MMFRSSIRPGIRLLLTSLVVGLGVLAFGPEAAASDGELTLTVVDGAGPEGDAIVETLRNGLRNEDKIRYVDESKLLDRGEQFGVGVETLRDGDLRAEHARAFRETMRALDLHGILVFDRFRDVAQIVVIGPTGEELADHRKNVVDGELPAPRAEALLKESFGDLLPAWRSWREARDREAGTETSGDERNTSSGPETARRARVRSGGQTDETSSKPPDDGESSSPEASADTRAGSGESAGLDGGVTIRLGGVAGRHQLDARARNGVYRIGQVNPFVGARLELEAMLGRFDADRAGVSVDLFGSYAPFRAVDGQGGSISSDFSHLGLDITYLRRLSPRLRFQFATGFEALSLRLASNPTYTGNRYGQFRFTGGLTYRVVSSIDLEIGGGVGPLLSSDMSGGAFGDSLFAPALLGEASVELTAFEPVLLSVGYDIYHYDLTFRNPSVVDAPVDVSDTYQFGGLKISYAF